jgi:hypothetical protein
VRFLTLEEFAAIAKANPGPHWAGWQSRWQYHCRAVEIAQTLRLSGPSSVLEIGTMGAQIVHGSDTMDFGDVAVWDFRGRKATIWHDARETPWPMADRRYELLIALRVYQHLVPAQEAAFREALRVADNVIIAVPSVYSEGRGIPPRRFLEWRDTPPAIMERVGNGDTYIYLWRRDDDV